MHRLKKIINNIGGNVFGKGYYKLIIHIKLLLSRRNSPVLIWQMGKVGSSTIVNSLKQSNYKGAIFHIHALSDTLIKKGEMYQRATISSNASYMYNQALGEVLEKKNRNWKIITLIREPVSRNISSFFQNIDIYMPNLITSKSSNNTEMTDSLINVFFEKFDHDRPLEWLDIEVIPILGVDVYALPFDKKKGFIQISKSGSELLVIRMESLTEIGESVLRNFLNDETIQLVCSNVGSGKTYAALYDSFRSKIQMPMEYLDKMYTSKYSKHFYTDEEISAYRKKW